MESAGGFKLPPALAPSKSNAGATVHGQHHARDKTRGWRAKVGGGQTNVCRRAKTVHRRAAKNFFGAFRVALNRMQHHFGYNPAGAKHLPAHHVVKLLLPASAPSQGGLISPTNKPQFDFRHFNRPEMRLATGRWKFSVRAQMHATILNRVAGFFQMLDTVVERNYSGNLFAYFPAGFTTGLQWRFGMNR